MDSRTYRHFCALLTACAAMHAASAHAENTSTMAAGPTFWASSDNENFHTRRTGADFFPRLANQETSIGLRYLHHEFWQEGWSRSGEQLSVVAKSALAEGIRTWQAEAGAMSQNGHTLLKFDGNYTLPLSKSTAAELLINRDFVETQAALDQGIHFTFVGGSLEHQLHPKLTLVALAGYQKFSDDNNRKHARVRLIYQPDLDLGLTFQYRYRYYRSSENIAPRGYFNPERYQENMLLTGWRYRRSGWTGSMLAGVGAQNIADAPNDPSRMLEFALDSPSAGNQLLGLRAGYLQAASYGGPDYRYRYVQANWIIRF